MGKRINTASDAINDLNEATEVALGNLELKASNLARIPNPIFTTGINWDLVYSDQSFNVRDADSYRFEENEALYRSLMDRGLETRGSDNMSFSLQTDGRYLVLSGNLRHAMMAYGRAETLRIRESEGIPTTPDNPLPFQFLLGLVFSGLSREQETDLLCDHLMKKGLNEFELCKEIGEACYRLKLTDEKAAIKFGLKKSSIQRLRQRYSMPTVLAEYRKEKSKDGSIPFVKVGQKALTRLYSCYSADQAGGCTFRQEGLNFKLAWEEHKRNPESTGTTSPKAKPQDRDTILNQAKSFPAMFGNNPEVATVCDVLAWAGNDERDGQPVNLQVAMTRLREYCDSLRAERDEAFDRVLTLTDERDALIGERDALRAERDALIGERDALRAERDALKSKTSKSKV